MKPYLFCRLSDYERVAHLGHGIMEKINERNKNNRTSSAYTKVSSIHENKIDE